MSVILIIIVSVLVFLLFILFMYGVSVYNRLVKKRNLTDEAWSGIDVQLKRRHDLIPGLVNSVKGYAKHEKEVFENITQARSGAMNAESLKNRQQAENQLGKSLLDLFAVAENYPDLKADSSFLNLQTELANIEADIQKARRYYNGTAREKNILVESFPSNIIAGMLGAAKSNYFELDAPEERSKPIISF